MPDDLSGPFVAAVIPAAGRGLRMGGERKQFRHLGDSPLLVQTVRVFDRHPRVHSVVVAVPDNEEETVQRLLAESNLERVPRVVRGGATRSLSVRAGLAALDPSVEIVLVHDAVRPFLPPGLIDSVIEAAEASGAASLAIPVADSLRRQTDGYFAEPVERHDLYRVQTPQGFRREVLVDAVERAADRGDTNTTDDASLAMSAGYRVQLIPGSSLNFKITTEEDWLMASLLWMAWIDAGGDV